MGSRTDKRKKKMIRCSILTAFLCLACHTAHTWQNPAADLSAGRTACSLALAAESPSAACPLADGNYAVDLVLSGGSGKASVESPTLLTVKEGKCFARITWSSPNYDYMVVDGVKYDNQAADGGNSTFLIPVLVFDEEMPVIADTVAMGEPHEIAYTLHFYSDSIGAESSLPEEGAKRVLLMAAAIIIVGGILNYFTNKKRKRDYLGAGR